MINKLLHVNSATLPFQINNHKPMSSIQHKTKKFKHTASGGDEGYSRNDLPSRAEIKKTREVLKAKGYSSISPKQAMRRLFGGKP